MVAYVSLNSAATATSEEQVEFARRRLTAYKYPRRIYIVDDVPKTATDKIKRGALRSVEASNDASVSPKQDWAGSPAMSHEPRWVVPAPG